MDLGGPASYLTLTEGTPVLSRGGTEIGRVAHVLADAEADVFDGIVIDTSAGPGGHRFADAEVVAEMHERGVVLTLDDDAVRSLPDPSRNPATLETDAADTEPDRMQDRLKRAWDWISGNY